MKSVYLPPEKMLPDISLCRYFDTRFAPVGKSKQRDALCYELAYYFEGDGSVIIDGEAHSTNPGDIRFSRPGDRLCSVPHYKCYTIYFELGESGTLYTNPILSALPKHFHASNAFKEDFENLVRIFRNPDATSDVRLNAKLLDIICRLYDLVVSGKKYSSGVNICLDYMKNHFDRQVSLEDLGRLCGYSPLHVLRLFKQELGFSPHQYLTDLRINAAKDLLISTDISLSDVAKKSGFSSESHFNSLFKKNTGFTPGSYRRNIY